MDENQVMVSQEPALTKSAKELLNDIGKRFLLLLSKLISVKLIVFGVFVWLAIKSPDVVSGWALVAIGMVVIFGREALKYIDKLR